jgi:hypothetical protein
MRITFTSDHKEIWEPSNSNVRRVARWHLEGDDLVFTTETEGFYGRAGTTRRERITKISSDELVFTEGDAVGRWKRVR